MVAPGMSPAQGVDLSFGGTRFPRAYEVRQKLYDGAVHGLSTRYRKLERYEAFHKCLEYDHLKTGWDGLDSDRLEAISPNLAVPEGFVRAETDTPLRMRRPTAPMRLAPMVTDRFTGLLFGKDRSPKVSVEGDPDAEDFLKSVWKKTRFWRTMHLARTYGGSMGSVLVTLHLRKPGRWSYKAHNPKTIQDIIWEDPDLKIPAGVLIQYTFLEENEVLDKKGMRTGKYEQRPWLYRRIIDQEMDVTFEPQPITGNQLPTLRPDPHSTYRHGLGEFPGVWIQNLPSDDDLDGIPDCEGAYQMFEAIDRQISQSNKGLLANQDPTVVISRDKKFESLGIPLKKGSENALNVGMGGSAQYLEMSGGGVTAAGGFVKDLKQAAMDKVQCVLVDPTKISGAAQSAKAIEYIYGPMLEKAGRLRDQYGEAIETLADLTLSMARKWADPLAYEGNVRRTHFDLPPRIEEIDADPDNPDPAVGRVLKMIPRHPGKGGVVSLEWGAYFAETPQDIQTQVGNVATAYNAGLMDLETAVRRVARIFRVEDADGMLRRVREELAQKKEEAEMRMEGLFPSHELDQNVLEPEPGEGLPPEPPPV